MFIRRVAYLWLLCGGLLWGVLARAEVHSLTLEQALELATKQNPDVMIARLDQQRAEAGVTITKDPFHPKVFMGSGDAYIYGYPNTIDGSAPSLFQLQSKMSIYNRPQTYQVRSAEETARGSVFGTQAKGEEVAYQVADLFLTANQLNHQHQVLTQEIPGLQQMTQVVSAAVQEGSELPLDLDSAQLNLAISRQQIEAANLDLDYYEMMLAISLGYPATDRVTPVDSDFSQLMVPPSQDVAADSALSNNKELRQMQSNVVAKQMDLRSFQAQRLPQVDLIAQYALFLKQNYVQYFPSAKFQANNAELGASVKIPLLIGPAAKGYAEQARIDMQKIRIQMDQVRNRILGDTRRSYEQWEKAETLRKLSQQRLDYARRKVDVLLAQNSEGRTPLREVEQARLDESNDWIALYDAETQVARAKFAILRQTGALLAAIRAGHGAAQPQ